MAISAQARTALFLISAGAVLFASAGTFAIAAFWVYLAILAAIVIVSFLMLDPELLHERMRPGGKPLPLGVMLATAVFAMHWVVAGLDVGRFHWSDTIPRSLQVAGFVIFVAANALAFWAMHVNRFFSSIVRIQSDRGQYVVTAGPYAFVRLQAMRPASWSYWRVESPSAHGLLRLLSSPPTCHSSCTV
jgi:hypothetical protein